MTDTKREIMICDNIKRDNNGELTFAGYSLASLAAKYGTPLYLYDENKIREKCRAYTSSIKDFFGGDGRVMYASKAASFKRLYEIMKEEGMGVDVVSMGEIRTATLAGYPLENAYFHSNNKTDWDIAFAMDHGVGHFVVDNREELDVINAYDRARSCYLNIAETLSGGKHAAK